MGYLFEIKNSLNRNKFEKIHGYSLKVLEETGMKFMNKVILESLKSRGAKIDWAGQIVYFPKRLVENMLSDYRKEIRSGKIQKMLNGGVSFSYKTNSKIFCKFGAAAPNIFDWDIQKKRRATETDLINSIRIGEAIPEIGMVGCPIYIDEISGRKIEPDFIPIISAMFLSKNTRKLGNSEVNNEKQLKYLIEMGVILKGSLKKFREDPCFITAKESISPLVLDNNACEVLISLAKNGLPAIMIPMPIMGASVPINVSGSMIVCNAEILATMTAIRSIYPDATVGGGSITSLMDMRSGKIKFDTVNATKVDLALAQMYDEFYGLDYGYGIYCSDAKFLGPEIIYERMMKLIGALFLRKFNYVIGLFDQGMIYSHELAIVEIDIIKSLHQMISDIDIGDLDVSFDTIKM